MKEKCISNRKHFAAIQRANRNDIKRPALNSKTKYKSQIVYMTCVCVYDLVCAQIRKIKMGMPNAHISKLLLFFFFKKGRHYTIHTDTCIFSDVGKFKLFLENCTNNSINKVKMCDHIVFIQKYIIGNRHRTLQYLCSCFVFALGIASIVWNPCNDSKNWILKLFVIYFCVFSFKFEIKAIIAWWWWNKQP